MRSTYDIRAEFDKRRCPENMGCNAARTCVCGMVDMTLDDRERMEKALRDIEAWARAYPVKVFPEMTPHDRAAASGALKGVGLTLDRVSADAMRHVLDGVINIVRDGLGSGGPNEQETRPP